MRRIKLGARIEEEPHAGEKGVLSHIRRGIVYTLGLEIRAVGAGFFAVALAFVLTQVRGR